MQGISYGRNMQIKYQRMIIYQYYKMHSQKYSSFETNEDSQVVFVEQNFQKIIRSFPDEAFPSQILYTGNISDLWPKFLEKLDSHLDDFDEVDYKILRESIESARIYYIVLTLEQLTQKYIEVKQALNQYFQKILEERQVYFDSGQILSSNFFENFICKNQKFGQIQSRKGIISAIYKIQFHLVTREALNQYFWLLLSFIVKILRKNYAISETQLFDLIYMKTILSFSITHPTLEKASFSHIVISQFKFSVLLKKNGQHFLMRKLKKMSNKQKVEEIQKVQKNKDQY